MSTSLLYHGFGISGYPLYTNRLSWRRSNFHNIQKEI